MIDSSVAAERTAAQAVFTGQAEEAEVAGKPGHQSPLHREQPAAGLIELEGKLHQPADLLHTSDYYVLGMSLLAVCIVLVPNAQTL